MNAPLQTRQAGLLNETAPKLITKSMTMDTTTIRSVADEWLELDKEFLAVEVNLTLPYT